MASALMAFVQGRDDEDAVTGAIIVAETMDAIRIIALTMGMKEPPVPPPDEE